MVHWRRNMNWVMFVLVVHRRGRGRGRMMFMVDRGVVVWLVVLWFVQLRLISVGVVVVLRLRSVQRSLLVRNLLRVAVLRSVGLGRVGNIIKGGWRWLMVCRWRWRWVIIGWRWWRRWRWRRWRW